jgi:hypothetical protein
MVDLLLPPVVVAEPTQVVAPVPAAPDVVVTAA